MNWRAVSLLVLLNIFLSLVLQIPGWNLRVTEWESLVRGEQKSFLQVFLVYTEFWEMLGLDDRNDFKMTGMISIFEV